MKRTYINAALVALLLSGLGAPQGLADQKVITGNVDNLPCSLINTEHPNGLTLRKFAGNPYSEKKSASVADVDFKISRVNLDMNTECELAKEMQIAEAAKRGYEWTRTFTTDAKGVIAIQLPAGLYLIEEQEPKDGREGEYLKSTPHLILLPTGNVDGKSWNYDTVAVVKGETPPGIFNTTEPSPTPPAPPTPNVPPVPGTTTPNVPPEPGTTTPKTPTPTPVTTTITYPGPPPTTVTQTITPSVPAKVTTTPAVPGTPTRGVTTTPNKPGTTQKLSLANTGASVLGIVGIGAVLLFLGLFLARRRKQNGAD